MTITEASKSEEASNYTDDDRARDIKSFDESKSGVKGLVDSGVTEIPNIFRQPPAGDCDGAAAHEGFSGVTIPIIDLHGIDRERIVDQVRDASERWGFFQVVNHGIPVSVLEEMKDGVRRFFEQDDQVKRGYYTRDIVNNKFVYNSNFDLYTASVANWRDTFFCYMAPHPPESQDLPLACRDILIEYSKGVTKLGLTLFELLSEALGLRSEHLKETECADGLVVIGHYYPACPEPDLTLGTSKHSDNDFLTVLLQDQIGGLQVLSSDKDQLWVDVPPVPGALVVNIGDLLQLMTNDKFKSVEHRVRANRVGPRISVASFFSTSFQPSDKLFGPIPQLLSDQNPPRYRETTVTDYLAYFKEHGLDGTSPLRHFML